MKQGVLHQIYITNDVESHYLVLPKEYHQAMLHMLHDELWSSGNGLNIGSSNGKILLGHNEPRHN